MYDIVSTKNANTIAQHVQLSKLPPPHFFGNQQNLREEQPNTSDSQTVTDDNQGRRSENGAGRNLRSGYARMRVERSDPSSLRLLPYPLSARWQFEFVEAA